MRTLKRMLALSLLCCVELPAQQASGRLSGVITDASGATVPQVAITVTNVGTGESRRVESNASGVYVASSLSVGDYKIEAGKQGFRSISRTGIRLDVNSSPTVDLVLEVGNITEKVTIEAAAPLVDTESQAIGNSRYEVQLKNLPIIVREIQALVGQTAGVPYGTTDTVGGNVQQGGRSAMQVLADGAQLNPFQTTAWPAIDGIGRRADLTVPGVDSIAEVKWITNGGSAEYSQPTQVIVASKSGTNSLHGSLFESYRSGGMGARRWEAANRESFVRHQYGGTIGGPIRRDKMFFYGGIDNFRHTSGAVLNARYPTAQERSGDLTALLQRTDARGAAAPITIYDPLTGQPFPGNVIPSSRISPVSAELLKMIPDAPAPGRLTDFNAIFFKPQFDNSDKYDARFDWEVNSTNRVFARTTIAHLDQASRFSGSVPGDYGYSTKNQWTHAAAANWTRIFSPSTVGTMQFTFRSMPFKNLPSRGDETFPVPINDVNAKPPFGGPPAIVIGTNGLGISDLFDRLLFNYSADYGYTFDPTVTKTVANHTVKAGFTFLRGYKTQELASPPYGRFTTASDFNNPRSTSSATGDAFADFLLGLPSSTDVTVGTAGAFLSKTNYAGFVQDDWKITPRLTLNFGLRYNRFGFFEEMNNRYINADYESGKIVIPTGSEALIQPAFQPFMDRYLSAAQAGLPNTLIHSNKFDFDPRFGFAYRAGRGFVLRGGLGIYSADLTYNEFQDGLNSPPFTRRAQLSRSLLLSQSVNVNSRFTFQNPTADSSTAGSDTQLTSVGGFARNYPTQRAYTWNFTIEKELGGRMALRTSYLGNSTRNMSRSVRLNSCAPGPTECLARAANAPGARKWQQFNMNIGRHLADGESNYHSWEIELTRRFSGGLLFDVNYAHSRLLGYQAEASDPVTDPKWHYDYGPVSAQPTDIFHWNYVYQLPFGRGRAFGSNIPWLVQAVAGDWMISGLGTWQTGQPLTVLAGAGQSPTGVGALRADRVADGTLDHSGSRGDNAYQWFDTTAYRLPDFVDSAAPRPTRQFGTAGPGTVMGPSFFTYDMTAQKTFPIRERYNLQFRVEVFNPFNIPMLGNPDLTVTSGTFGRIRTSNANYTPRNIQLGARLDF